MKFGAAVTKSAAGQRLIAAPLIVTIKAFALRHVA